MHKACTIRNATQQTQQTQQLQKRDPQVFEPGGVRFEDWLFTRGGAAPPDGQRCSARVRDHPVGTQVGAAAARLCVVWPRPLHSASALLCLPVTCAYACVRACARARVRVHARVFVLLRVRAHARVHVCECVCVCACVF